MRYLDIYLFYVYARSILDRREFEWESQLRFYWEKDTDELVIRQCTGEFGYGYEYMGASYLLTQ